MAKSEWRAGGVPGGPWSVLWTGPGILLASLMIAWGAECSQFFVAQGLALAILAWLQTMPEFAVEAVLGYHQQSQYLLASLTGALRLLTGLGWPMIYLSAALSYRSQNKAPLRKIVLPEHQSIQVIGLAACLAYVSVIAVKASLTVWDSCLPESRSMPATCGLWTRPHRRPRGDRRPRRHPQSHRAGAPSRPHRGHRGAVSRRRRLIYLLTEPFLNSLFALATTAGISEFVFIQWVYPFVSEFPEFFSAFHWARSIGKAPMALMNLVPSNINCGPSSPPPPFPSDTAASCRSSSTPSSVSNTS